MPSGIILPNFSFRIISRTPTLTYIGDRFELDRKLLIVNNAVNACYTVDVDIKDMEIDGGTAEVKFYETYRYARTNTPDITSAEGLSYKVELKKINGARY